MTDALLRAVLAVAVVGGTAAFTFAVLEFRDAWRKAHR